MKLLYILLYCYFMYCILTMLVRRFLKINDWGRVRIEGEEVYVLTYANDIVLIAEEKENAGNDVEADGVFKIRKKVELNIGKYG